MGLVLGTFGLVKRTRRSGLVMVAVIWSVILGVFTWMVVIGGAQGALIVGSALTFTAMWVSLVIFVVSAGNKRRTRAVAAQHPGWTFVTALTTRTQFAAMRAAGRRMVVGASVTFGYGPDGVGIWTTHRRKAAEVLMWSWAQVRDAVEADDLTTNRGYPAPGIRIHLTDCTTQDLRVAATKAMRSAHPGTSPAGAVVADILAVRSGAVRHPQANAAVRTGPPTPGREP